MTSKPQHGPGTCGNCAAKGLTGISAAHSAVDCPQNVYSLFKGEFEDITEADGTE